jgi:protoporphyrin/coproporphyrin ferrochelatase
MKGVLLVNLGSPDSTDPKDVKKYLGEFLMDPRVIDVPYLFRALLVKGIILNTRPKKSAKAYAKIWWKEGSPLIVLSERLQGKVQTKTEMPVGLAMRYGAMNMKKGIQELVDKGVDDILIFPLYPQFAMATTETITVLADELQKEFFPNIKLSSVPAFYNNDEYIEVLANNINKQIKDLDYEHLLFSYHGIPERHIRKQDITKSHCKIDGSCCNTPSKAHEFCYRHQCFEVTKLVAKKLNFKEGSFSTSFQSRLGTDQWLLPYTDRTIEKFGLNGMKKMAVVTPAFVSDCLETLEEIAMEGKELFEEVGGEEFTTLSCLNEDEAWANTIGKWVNEWAN